METFEIGMYGDELVTALNSNAAACLEKDEQPYAATDIQIKDVRMVGDASIIPEIPNCYPQRNDTVGCSICFVFDSNRLEIIEQYTRAASGFPVGGWAGIFEAHGVRLNVSCGYFDEPFDDDFPASDMLTLISRGHEFMAHAMIAYTPNATEEELYETLKTQSDYFQSVGLSPKHCNYFGGYNNIAAASVLRKFYKSAGTVMPPSQSAYMPVNHYQQSRIPMDTIKYNDWIGYVDALLEKGVGMQTFYCHPYADAFYDEPRDDDGNPDAGGDYGWQKVVRLIEYIQAQGSSDMDSSGDWSASIKIETMDQAVTRHANLIDCGYGTEFGYKVNTSVFGSSEYFRLSKSGAVSSKKLDCIDIDNRTVLGRAAAYETTNYQVVAIGLNAARSLSGSSPSVCIGNDSGRSSSGGLISIGNQAGLSNTGSTVVVIGDQAGSSNTGVALVAIGNNAGYHNTGIACVSLGRESLYNNTGDQCTAIGDHAGTGNNQPYLTAVGLYAGDTNRGTSSTFMGTNSGRLNTGARVLGIGYEAARDNTGVNLLAIGYQAGKSNIENGVFLIENRNLSASNPLIKGYFSSGSIILGAPNVAISDVSMGNSRLTFWIDEESSGGMFLKFKVKDSHGHIRTAELELT